MVDTDPLYGLAEMLEYLAGLQSTSAGVDLARAGLAYLDSAGFALVHRSRPLALGSTSPEDVRAARKALRLSNAQLAREAGVSINAVITAQAVDVVPRPRALRAIVAALTRLASSPATDEEPSTGTRI